MGSSRPPLPARRADLIIQKISDDEFVIKLPARRRFFSVGPAEIFLLNLLDGKNTRRDVRKAFQAEFSEELSRQDVRDFLKLAESEGLLATEASEKAAENLKSADADGFDESSSGRGGNLMFYRVPLFDPDRLFNWLEPKIRFLWTRGFLIVSLLAMAFAFLIFLANGQDLAQMLSQSLQWETIVVAWVMIILATTLHEFAHGLTCKHFGGEVREVGVLLMFFIPCLYCNVSDAWLIPEKRKRLLITFAGGYHDLCLWALGVFFWRLTVPGTFLNYLAFVLLTVCGGRGFINLNPLLRLDGYYLVSDWLEIPNLRRRSQEYLMGHFRWLLWGAERPAPQERGRVLIIYGLISWSFAIVFLDLILLRFLKIASDEFGLAGILFFCMLLAYGIRRVFKGFFKSELRIMLKLRKQRTLVWILGIAGLVGSVFLLPVKHYSTGDFEVRPMTRFEVNSPITGFIREILVSEGDAVAAGDVLFKLSSATLESELITKETELNEVVARLRQLKRGPRQEEIAQQTERVKRLEQWWKAGRADLVLSSETQKQELLARDHRIRSLQSEIQQHQRHYQQSKWMYQQGALAAVDLQREYTEAIQLQAQLATAQAEKAAKVSAGIRVDERTVAERLQALEEARASLALLQAGTRPETIEETEARQARLLQEMEYLKAEREKLVVHAPIAGIIATPRLQEKLGQLAGQGMPLLVIEDSSRSRVEIALTEPQLRGVEPGQPVSLKARAYPFQTFDGTVEQIAPTTIRKEGAMESVVIVYCELENPDGALKTGMTGFCRVLRGWNTLGLVMGAKAMKYLRTEFWW